ncbi:hypothetical protein BC834DRAFT_1010193 [Gloeopeniophorella convolvens]|nr:hypothetical protein BC834DRAFT_1010193 [Gloeopeniophorella convolvens]
MVLLALHTQKQSPRAHLRTRPARHRARLRLGDPHHLGRGRRVLYALSGCRWPALATSPQNTTPILLIADAQVPAPPPDGQTLSGMFCGTYMRRAWRWRAGCARRWCFSLMTYSRTGARSSRIKSSRITLNTFTTSSHSTPVSRCGTSLATWMSASAYQTHSASTSASATSATLGA